MLFFTLLAAFFAVSWLWHWVWFSSGAGFVSDRLVPWMCSQAGDRQAAASITVTAIKASLTLLVGAVLVGFYLVIYSLLG